MKKFLSIAVMALFVAPFFTSCDKNDDYSHPREVIIMNENGDVITGDTIEVKLGSTNRTVFTMWYEHLWKDTVYSEDTLYFWRQYDDNEPEDLSIKPDPDRKYFVIRHEDLESLEGWSGGGSNNVSGGKYEMRTAFSKKFVHAGSLVKIWACVGDYAKGEVYYKVVE